VPLQIIIITKITFLHETPAESGSREVQQAVRTGTRSGRSDQPTEARPVRDFDKVPVRETLHGVG